MFNKVLNQLINKYNTFEFKGKVTLFFCKEFYEYMVEVFGVDYVFTNNDYKIIKKYFRLNNRNRYVPNDNINELYNCFDNNDFYETWKIFKKYEIGYIKLKLSPEELEIYFNEELLYDSIISYLKNKFSEYNEKHLLSLTKYDLIEIFYEDNIFPINCVGIYLLEQIYRTQIMKKFTFNENVFENYEFDVKKNDVKWDRKNQLKYMKHLTGKYKSFMIDIIFLGKYSYLLLVNVNTRKMYCKCLNILYFDGHISFKNPKNYTTSDIINAIRDIDIRHIYCDQDNKFLSNNFIEYCKRKNITIIETTHINKYNGKNYNIHGLLSILDRSVRTIRKYLYNAGDPDPNPVVINQLVDYYNNKSHKGVRNILRMNVTPNQLDNDIRLEKLLVKRACKNNLITVITTDYSLTPGTKVRVYKPIENKFEKRPTQFFPGIWTVIEHNYNKLVKIRNDNGNEMEVPRWHLIKLEN